MVATGTLRTWHDDRGVGFIAPTNGGHEIFVHISGFAQDGSRPTVGEKLSFELARGQDGRVQACHVVRLAMGRDARQPGSSTTAPVPPWMATTMAFPVSSSGVPAVPPSSAARAMPKPSAGATPQVSAHGPGQGVNSRPRHPPPLVRRAP